MGATALIIGTVVGAIAAIGSGVMSYMQGQQQAAAQRQQAAYAQAMGLRSQQISEIAAGQALQKGEYEANLLREKQHKLMGRQLALYGASGVDIYGSPLEVMGESYAEGSRDIDTTLKNAHYEAWKYKTGGETSLIEGSAIASRYETQANITESAGTSTLVMAPLVAGSSILTAYARSKNPSGWGWGTE